MEPPTEKILNEPFCSGHSLEKTLSRVGTPEGVDTVNPEKPSLREDSCLGDGRPRFCLIGEAQTDWREGGCSAADLSYQPQEVSLPLRTRFITLLLKAVISPGEQVKKNSLATTLRL